MRERRYGGSVRRERRTFRARRDARRLAGSERVELFAVEDVFGDLSEANLHGSVKGYEKHDDMEHNRFDDEPRAAAQSVRSVPKAVSQSRVAVLSV